MKSISDELGLLEKWYEKTQPKFLTLEEVISQYCKSLGEHEIGYPLVDLEEQFKKVLSPAFHSYLSAGCYFLNSLDVVCTLASASSPFQRQNRLI